MSGLLLAGDDTDRVGAAGERELGGVTAESAAGAPDQHVVALLHAGAVAGDQLPVRGGVHQTGCGGLLPAEVVRLRHQLVGLDERDLGEAAEVGLEAPDPLLGVEHRVVVAVGRLQLDGQAVRDDLVAGPPGVDAGAGAQDDAREVGADDVVRQVVALGQLGELSVALQEAEGGQRLEDRGPHGVVVHRGGHDGHQGLARTEFRAPARRRGGATCGGPCRGWSSPANISVSSLCTVIARYDSGSGRAAKSADVESGDWIASRISFTVVPPAKSV